MKRAPLFFALLFLVVACGSRTEVFGDVGSAPDASRKDVVDAGVPDVRPDVAPDVVPDVQPVDVALPDTAPPPCTADSECDDGVACTDDHCDLMTGMCTHTPDNALCPSGFACQPPCVAASFAENSDSLYGVALPAGVVSTVGSTSGVTLDDIALDAHGTLYGVGGAGLYTVDTKTGAPTFVTAVSIPLSLNALDFGPDGTLYAAASGSAAVYTVDPKSGEMKQVASYPAPYTSSGDLAIIGTELLATVTGGSSDHIISIDLTTFVATDVGPTGHTDIWGLAAYGTQLFGYTDTGDVLQIDPTTAKSTVLAKTGIQFYGASAR
jgi:hypothetical protein